MKKYRTTFIAKTRNDDDNVKIDLAAENMDDAFHKAYNTLKRRLGRNPYDLYSDASTEEFPEGASNIGIRFLYYDRMLRRDCSQYLVIRASSEEQAKEWYGKNLKGKKFLQPWPDEPRDDGNCTYGDVKATYFAACPGFHFDASVGLERQAKSA